MLYYIKKSAAIAFLLFMGLWVAGIVRGFMLEYPPPAPHVLDPLIFERERFAHSNSQFANNLRQIDPFGTPLPMMLDAPVLEKVHIHEKRAFLTSSTTAFNEDEIRIRAFIKEQDARVFAEKKSGLEPGRRWTAEIGVHPDKFDAFVEQLRGVGVLASISVDQKDRTSEFHKLNAQRQSLKKYLESIMKLREGKTPSLEDSLRLEGKIQDIEKELQGLSVQFGELLGKESFYHVHVALVEHQPGDRRDRTYTVPQRIGHAFVWAIAWWLGVAAFIGVLAASALSVMVLRQRKTT